MKLLLILAAVVLALLVRKEAFVPVSTRQLGGKPAPPNRYPYVCRIQTRGNRYGSGCLVDPYTVITAAHVVSYKNNAPVPAKDITVKIGSIYPEHGEKHGVQSVTKNSIQDWAILRLKTPSRMKPVLCNGYNINVPVAKGDIVTNVGFGLTGPGTPATRLQENVFKVVGFEGQRIVLTGNFKHPGYASDMRKPCGGDSGSPTIKRVKMGTSYVDVCIGVNYQSTGGKECVVNADSKSWITPTTLFLKRPSPSQQSGRVASLTKGCALTSRVKQPNGAYRCPPSHPWDAGTWDQGPATPVGFKGAQCAKSAKCANTLNDLYRAGGAAVIPPHYYAV